MAPFKGENTTFYILSIYNLISCVYMENDHIFSNFRALKKMVQDHPSDWDSYIKLTVFGLRMYGREARYPSEILVKWQVLWHLPTVGTALVSICIFLL